MNDDEFTRRLKHRTLPTQTQYLLSQSRKRARWFALGQFVGFIVIVAIILAVVAVATRK